MTDKRNLLTHFIEQRQMWIDCARDQTNVPVSVAFCCSRGRLSTSAQAKIMWMTKYLKAIYLFRLTGSSSTVYATLSFSRVAWIVVFSVDFIEVHIRSVLCVPRSRSTYVPN